MLVWSSAVFELLLKHDAVRAPEGPSGADTSNRLDVTILSAQWCGACRKAKRPLDSEDVLYTVRDIDNDPGARDEVRQILGKVTIPLIDVNGTYVSGYNRQTLLRLIKGG